MREPVIDEINTMRPACCSRMTGMHALTTRKVLVRLVSITECHSSIVISSIGVSG